MYKSLCKYIDALHSGKPSEELWESFKLCYVYHKALGDFVEEGTITTDATSAFARFSLDSISNASDTLIISADTTPIGPITLGSTVVATASATVVSALVATGFPAFYDGTQIIVYAPDLTYNGTSFLASGSVGVTLTLIDNEFNDGSEAVIEGADDCLTQEEGLYLLDKQCYG